MSKGPWKRDRSDLVRLIDLKAGGRRLGMGYQAMRALVAKGVIPIVKLPSGLARDGSARRQMVDIRDLDKLIEEHKERLG